MTAFATIFLIANAIALLTLPRRWALVPILMGAFYMTGAQKIEIGPFNFTVLRLLLLIGALRIVICRERLSGGLIALDRVLLAWGAWLMVSSLFHKPFSQALVFRLGAMYNVLGFYFITRFFCHGKADIIRLIKVTAVLLGPVACEMVFENLTGKNVFAVLGGVPETPEIRNGKFRAQGPFGHSILAGCVGAMCIPLMVGIWKQHRRVAFAGIAACLGMVGACHSSGPIMDVLLGIFALSIWKWRYLTRRLRLAAFVGYFLLNAIMNSPAYYILARIDLTGSSTGWHRARLIESAIEHLNEWWFAGTDYTRHWMPYGVSASEDHCDLTNQYLFYGTWGGLPLMFLFIAALWIAFKYVGTLLNNATDVDLPDQFIIWSLGASLFAHAVNCVSVAYFDQSIMFVYLNIAAIGAWRGAAVCYSNGRFQDHPSLREPEASELTQVI